MRPTAMTIDELVEKWAPKKVVDDIVIKGDGSITVDKRIYMANKVASDDDADFSKLKEFAKNHPIIMSDVLRVYLQSPDARFGDTLLIFCSCIMNCQIEVPGFMFHGPHGK